MSAGWISRLLLFAVGGATALTGSLRAAGIDDARDAAAFIVVTAGNGGCTGSGFLVERTQTDLYIVTNDHVVADLRKPGQQSTLEAVFRSGTRDERTVKAAVLAFDTVNDLALLKAPVFPGAPEPIRLARAIEPRIGQELTLIGFPLGSALAEAGKNPLVTITQAHVSQGFRTPFGLTKRIDLTGGAYMGNSGGPAVDAEGRLAGVVVAIIIGSKDVRIIPAERVRDLWQGVYLADRPELRSGYGLTGTFSVSCLPLDPFGHVTDARLVVLPAGNLPEAADLAAFHGLAAKHLSIPIPKQSLPPGQRTTISLDLKLSSPAENGFLLAPQVGRDDGTVWLGPPELFELPDAVSPEPLVLDTREVETMFGSDRFAPPKARPEPTDDGAAYLYAKKLRKVGPTAVRETLAEDGLSILSPEFETKALTPPCWVNGGKAAVFLDADGWLVKVSLPTFERTAACQLVWPDGEGIQRIGKEIEVASRRALVGSRSYLLLLSRAGETTGCVHVISPDTLDVVDFLSLPGAVSLSAVPDSDSVLVRYGNGELALLATETGRLSPLCRPEAARALRGSAVPDVPVLPRRRIDDAVLVSPGKHMLVLGENRVYAIELLASGIRPVDARTPVWDNCRAICYQPGDAAAVLVPSMNSETTRLVDLHSFAATNLPRCEPNAFLTAKATNLVELRDARPWPVLNLHSVANAGIRTRPWPVADVDLGSLIPAVHPRGNCYWLHSADRTFWVEEGKPWLTARRMAQVRPPSDDPSDGARELGWNADLHIAELSLPATGVTGACWTSDGERALVAWTDGTIRSLEAPNLRVTATRQLGRPCTSLALSGAGPVATLTTDSGTDVVVLEESSLAPERRLSFPPATAVAAGSRTPVAVVAVRNVGIRYANLDTGKMTAPQAAYPCPGLDGPLDLRRIDKIALSPDGRRVYLLVQGRLVTWNLVDGKRTAEGLLDGTKAAAPFRLVDMTLSADAVFLDVRLEDAAGKKWHEVRSAQQLRLVYRQFRDDRQIVFDCGARRLLYTGETPHDTYPFASSPRDAAVVGGLPNPVSFSCGPRVLPHPLGNLLLAFGTHIHALRYTTEAVQ